MAGHPWGRLGATRLDSCGKARGRDAKGAFRCQLKSEFGSDISLWTQVESFLDSVHGELGWEPAAGSLVVQWLRFDWSLLSAFSCFLAV